MSAPLLKVENVSIAFGGVKAVQGVSFEVSAGSITALIGPNGAGKTTVFSLISGFVTPQSGEIYYQGEPLAKLPAHKRAALGIGRTFQIVQPFAGQSVLENIAVGSHLHIAQRSAALEHAREVAQSLSLGAIVDQDAASLTIAQRKRLEVAKAVATQPRLLLLDEVLAGLNPAEVQEMLPVVHALCARGITVLMIEHVMQAVMHLAQTVYVLASGQLIAHGTPEQVTSDPLVIQAYLGQGAAKRLQAARQV
jgi:branched-chain amino acid transport system ATP-binding protein